MKLNFGHGIAAALALFIIYILSFVYQSFQQDVNLVTENYYEREIRHEEHINKVRNEKALPAKIEIVNEANAVTIVYPAGYENIKGNITFFRPADSKQDIRMPITNQNGKQVISKAALLQGRYKVQLDWQLEEELYYKEVDLYL